MKSYPSIISVTSFFFGALCMTFYAARSIELKCEGKLFGQNIFFYMCVTFFTEFLFNLLIKCLQSGVIYLCHSAMDDFMVFYTMGHVDLKCEGKLFGQILCIIYVFSLCGQSARAVQ